MFEKTKSKIDGKKRVTGPKGHICVQREQLARNQYPRAVSSDTSPLLSLSEYCCQASVVK